MLGTLWVGLHPASCTEATARILVLGLAHAHPSALGQELDRDLVPSAVPQPGSPAWDTCGKQEGGHSCPPALGVAVPPPGTTLGTEGQEGSVGAPALSESPAPLVWERPRSAPGRPGAGRGILQNFNRGRCGQHLSDLQRESAFREMPRGSPRMVAQFHPQHPWV